MPKDANVIGRNVAKLRYQRGWSQNDLVTELHLLGDINMTREKLANIETLRCTGRQTSRSNSLPKCSASRSRTCFLRNGTSSARKDGHQIARCSPGGAVQPALLKNRHRLPNAPKPIKFSWLSDATIRI